MPSTTMNVNLSEDLYDFVKAAVQSGRYTSASEVVREALRTRRDLDLREVEKKIERGLTSLRRGEVYDGEQVFSQILSRRVSFARRVPRKERQTGKHS